MDSFFTIQQGDFPKYTTETKTLIMLMLLGWYIICEFLITTILEVAAVLFYHTGGQIRGVSEPELGWHYPSRGRVLKK
jgi:hypothetical protein